MLVEVRVLNLPYPSLFTGDQLPAGDLSWDNYGIMNALAYGSSIDQGLTISTWSCTDTEPTGGRIPVDGSYL